MKRICPRCNALLSSNCYVKDKGINTLSYLELIIKKINFKKKIKKSNHVIVQNVVMLNFILTLMIQINIIIMMMI